MTTEFHETFLQIAEKQIQIGLSAAELPRQSLFHSMQRMTESLIEKGLKATDEQAATDILTKLVGKLTMDWKYAAREGDMPGFETAPILSNLEDMLHTVQTALGEVDVPAMR
ncbi:hypothetical protein D3C71_496940 [compost metagenome]